ncbi:MAG TPA: ADP-polyphosphate phosphotransferase [Acidobacteriaceae bacterium]|nr:ADP-polyphosphate phosphotransferase [Acidobacteriaceae bacterium]
MAKGSAGKAKANTPMKIDIRKFRIDQGEKVRLNEWPTRVKPICKSKEEYEAILASHVQQLEQQQEMLYALDEYALLVIFQGMDASGKDGAIRHVMSGVNPQGCQVSSFKQPSTEELEHDFLWRAVQRLPERGRIGIFNRSYYEEVLVVRVHPEILATEKLTGEIRHEKLKDKDVWKQRYRSMVDLERHLHQNGTRVVKVFLHLSKDEQKRRFLARIDDPEKNWKFGAADIQERKFWKQYTSAFQECLEATSTKHAPWYAVPADDKHDARLIVSQIILDELGDLKMSYPKATEARRKQLEDIRKTLTD